MQLNNNRIISEFKLEKQSLDRKIENLITLNNEVKIKIFDKKFNI